MSMESNITNYSGFGVPLDMNSSHSFYMPSVRIDDVYYIDVNDILAKMQYRYALLIFVLSSVLLIYVLWNNFARSPSKPKSIKAVIESNLYFENREYTSISDALLTDEGVDPSVKVKRISRTLDEHMIVPALVLFYISFSYLWTFYR